MFTFGAGVMIATPTLDAQGNAIATTSQSPVQFGILQEVGVDMEWDDKMLYGANQFPVDVGRGKGKLTLKAKFAQINAELYNSVLFGQTLVSGYANIYNDLTGTAVPGTAGSTGGTVTVVPPATGVFEKDLGVTDASAVPYTRVASNPTGGQYTVNATGTYGFGPQSNGSTVFVNYAYTNASNPVAAKKTTVVNLPMGYAPFFQVDLMAKKNGNTLYWRFPQVMATKLSQGFKNDDYTIPDMDMTAFADSSGNIVYNWASN